MAKNKMKRTYTCELLNPGSFKSSVNPKQFPKKAGIDNRFFWWLMVFKLIVILNED
jgi:hypothetical protein